MIKQMVLTVALASAPGPVLAQGWQAEHTRLATAKTINRLADYCGELGFDRATPVDDHALSEKTLEYLLVVPDPDLAFAAWIRGIEKMKSFKENEAHIASDDMGDALIAAISDPSASSRTRAEELYVRSVVPILTHGLEECQTGARDPFLGTLWSGTASINFESLARRMFREILHAVEMAQRQR